MELGWRASHSGPGAGPRRPLVLPLLPHSSTLLHLAVKLVPFALTSQCLRAQLRLCNSEYFCCSCELVRLPVVGRLRAAGHTARPVTKGEHTLTSAGPTGCRGGMTSWWLPRPRTRLKQSPGSADWRTNGARLKPSRNLSPEVAHETISEELSNEFLGATCFSSPSR